MLRRQGWSSLWIWMGPCKCGRTESEPDVGESLKTACKIHTVCSVSQLHRVYLLLDLWLTWNGKNPWNFYWLAQRFIFILPFSVFVFEDKCFIIFHWPQFFASDFCCCLLCMCACVLNRVWLFVTPWIVDFQTPLSVEFSRQECWSGLPFPTLRNLPNPGIKPTSPASPTLTGGFFTTAHHLGNCFLLSFIFLIKRFLFYIWNINTKQNTRETVLFELSIVFFLFYAIQEALVSSVPKFWLLLILSSFISVLSTSFHVKFEMYPNLYPKIAFWTF